MKNLIELRDAMKAHDPSTLDAHGQWRSDLPTFGGDEPESTEQVWSWDEDSLLVGTSRDDLEIIAR